MYFGSDNTGPVHPAVMEALVAANTGFTGSYGADPLMDQARTQLREIFDAPEAEVFLVATGTAANCLGLACHCPPTHTIFCSPTAHIHEDECNAPEFYTSGAKLTLVGTDDKISPQALARAIEAEGNRFPHGPARGPLSLTQATERGQIYTLDEIRALTAVAKSHDLPVHMDGARFGNALVALGCTPAEMTWRAGVDVLSFGGTKNGCMGVEAVILFDPARATEFQLRRKRGAQLFSKHRYLSAQMVAYLANDLWLTTAKQANDNMARLADGLRKIPGVTFDYEPAVNMAFLTIPSPLAKRLKAEGTAFNIMQGSPDTDDAVTIRLVTDWSIAAADIDRFLALAAG